jgi:hypothetical protein
MKIQQVWNSISMVTAAELCRKLEHFDGLSLTATILLFANRPSGEVHENTATEISTLHLDTYIRKPRGRLCNGRVFIRRQPNRKDRV